MPISLPPVLAGQAKASDKEVATAQEAMVQVFSREQDAAMEGRAVIAAAVAAGEDIQLHVYNNRLPSCHYVFKDGSQATFVNGIYKTGNPYEIEQLDKEVRMNHPHIFIDKSTPAVVSAKLDADPMAALRDKLRAEIIAELKPKDMGSNRTLGSGELVPAGTDKVQENVAGQGGNALPAALVAALNKNRAS